MALNAKTTADVRKRPPARPRAGQSWPLVPGVLDGQRMSRAHLADAEHHDGLSCARAGDGVFAGPEQHVGQFSDGARSRVEGLAQQCTEPDRTKSRGEEGEFTEPNGTNGRQSL